MATGVTLFTIAYLAILILPGVLFKRYYYYGRFAKQYSAGLFADRILTTLLWGIIIQTFCTLAFCGLIGVSFDHMLVKLNDLYGLMIKAEFPIITWKDIILVLLYVGTTLAFSMGLGFFLRWLVRKTKLDLRAQNFRMTDHWYYLFSGEQFEFEYKGIRNIEVTQSIVDVLVKDSDGENNLYSGIFNYYECDQKGELSTICLNKVKKACIGQARVEAGSESEEPDTVHRSKITWQRIPGHSFIIPYTNVLNMNIEYVVSELQDSKSIVRTKAALNILAGILLIFTFSTWIFPWFLDIPTKNKIMGALFAHLAFLFGAPIINHISNPDKKYRVGFFAFLIFLAAFLILVYNALRRFGFSPSLGDVFSSVSFAQ